jgi:hypothetical protein
VGNRSRQTGAKIRRINRKIEEPRRMNSQRRLFLDAFREPGIF